ncbi:helix-turn-helix domain-containing protein [Lacticaseibacillus yichunensis]|uniref:Helix-turn-helix domain-containing protein n=1 Tax=Lacticaseibacillus yichunensis TaxID=2486015 RepID=A0ABW4CN99_9LACO|nr:helix-turn-helix transcriptional regulator [Lacticaseibacillus yichunensis]
MSYRVDLSVIRTRRNGLHLSLTDMTKALGLSSVDQYYRRENGEYKFKAVELPALAQTLDVPIETFFTGNVEKITK